MPLSNSENSVSILATMRCCSLAGGIGIGNLLKAAPEISLKVVPVAFDSAKEPLINAVFQGKQMHKLLI
jgi:hypothetical protein